MLFGKKSESDSAKGDAAIMGLFSYGLGISQVLRPGTVNRVMGVPDHNPNHVVQRLLGVREIASGTGIFFGRNTSRWMWFRVAGDVMDISIIAGQLAARLGTRSKLVGTLLFLTAVLVFDVKTAIALRGHTKD
jgi:hypothetical protein